MLLTKEKIRSIGWISITNAAVTIFILLIRKFLDVADGITLKVINIFLSLFNLGLFVYIHISFKKILNQYLHIYVLDKFIYLVVSSNILAFIFSIWVFNNTTLEAMIANSFGLIVLGSTYMLFAVKILSLNNNFYGLLIPFAFTIIATGLCFATVILLPLALLISVVSDVILGIIFFRAAEQS